MRELFEEHKLLAYIDKAANCAARLGADTVGDLGCEDNEVEREKFFTELQLPSIKVKRLRAALEKLAAGVAEPAAAEEPSAEVAAAEREQLQERVAKAERAAAEAERAATAAAEREAEARACAVDMTKMRPTLTPTRPALACSCRTPLPARCTLPDLCKICRRA